ncbi:MAG: hypothetical protein EG823_00010 [Actinobacteria bacterium]|nr:hypothetical protein [Actinomycetota bacterium]
MAYFVVERSGADGSLRIPLKEEYPTREAAIAALSEATSSGEVVLEGEVFIADLGAAVPVLVMQAAPAAIAETVQAEAPEGSVLAEALKRAATSLEDEGIVAPESVEAEPEPEEAEGEGVSAFAEEAEAAEVEPLDETQGLTEAATEIAEPASLAAVVDEPPADKAWPWANVDAYEGEESAVAEESAEPEADESGSDEMAELAAAVASMEFESEDAEEGAEGGSLITSAPPEGEDAYVPHPVILGDYGDQPARGEVEAAVPAEETEIDEELESSLAEIEAAPTEGGSSEGEEEPSEADLAVEAAEEASEEPGYEATGELDLTEYTCNDCVYSNTCPKVGQATPADCGSFQWKSD